MSDRVFFASTIFLALAMIALALVWPQGEGARSPAPFGRRPSVPVYVEGERRKAAARAEAARLRADAAEAANKRAAAAAAAVPAAPAAPQTQAPAKQ